MPGLRNMEQAKQRAEVGGGMLNPVSDRAISYGEMITNDLQRAEQRVAELKRIQDLLAANPEFEELLTLVGRVGRY